MLESLNIAIFIGSALVLAADFTSLVCFWFGAHVRLLDGPLAGPVEGADDPDLCGEFAIAPDTLLPVLARPMTLRWPQAASRRPWRNSCVANLPATSSRATAFPMARST